MPTNLSHPEQLSLEVSVGAVEGVEEPPTQGSLGKIAGEGFSWISLSLIAGKTLSFLSQIVLGAILLDEEFGIFAIAISVSAFVSCFRDGGVPDIIVQKGSSKFEQLSGPTFWIGMWFSLAMGAILAGMSFHVANIYGDPKLVSLLLVIAITFPLGAPASILIAKLRCDLRFQTIAIIQVVSQFIRHVGAIVLALTGFGAMSFVLPLVVIAVFEDVASLAATRSAPWLKGHQFKEWPALLSKSLWVLLSAFFRGFALNGDYLVLGLLVSKKMVGQYFFGYQLAAQVILMLAMSVQQILFPVLSRLVNESARQAKAIVRSFRVLFFLSSPLCILLAVVIEPLDLLFWNGKWAAVVSLVQTFAFASPLRGLISFTHVILSARGYFQTRAWLILVQGIVLMAFAALGAFLFEGNLTGIALCVAISQSVFNVFTSFVVLRNFSVSFKQLVGAILPAYSVAVIAAIICLSLDRYFLATVAPLPRGIELALVFMALFFVPMRLLFRTCFDDLVGILPNRISDILQRLFFLSPQTNQHRLDS